MPLHPDMLKAIEAMQAFGFRPIAELSPEEAREQSEAMARLRAGDSAGDGIETRDGTLPVEGGDIRARFYRPPGAARDAKLPCLVYFHGGGHVIGSIDTHDSVARALCKGAGIAVVSVGYRKAPEHKFPVAAEDCYAATRWVHDNAGAIGVDGGRLAVGGDSAGGNLAAAVALMALDRGGPELKLQLLVYPIVDYACVSPTYEQFAEGYGPLTKVGMRWFRNHYLYADADADDWRASPLKAPSHRGLAPALFVTAECDVLLQDSLDYAEVLRAAGVAVEHAHFDGMMHGFFSMPATLQNTAAAHARAVAALKRAFA
jgi:acetyl esterase